MGAGYDIEAIALHETASERYLSYAMSVITARALPDVRDGLKPVQRRILYAMYQNLRLVHTAKHRKSAAVVGEVMAKYHPHGDQSIYDAMVRQAQDFSMRYPLVDGQGNFGSLDGDSAAAMRYTEARLTALSEELLAEIRKRTVAYRPTYDGTGSEPVVLPAQIPNLLINGATGIAVGMATNIPPHHLGEVIDALIALIDRPLTTLDEIVEQHIRGPDFPTGGVLLESEREIKKIYRTGSGGFTVRAEWEVEPAESGSRRQIVVRSIPYTVNKSSVVEKIGDLVMRNKIPQIEDVRDESSDEIRIVLELKRGAEPEAAMAFLFKYTQLQHRFHANLTCLVPTENEQVSAPAKLGLAEMLRHFLTFRHEVVRRRVEFELAQLEREIHRLEGFEIIFGDLDRAIRLIRASEGKADAATKLMDAFALDELQADAILETKLYRLARLEIESIRADLATKRAAAEKLRVLLSDERKMWRLIRRELKAIRSAYADPRRTQIGVEVRSLEFNEEKYIVDEEAIVIVTRDGWVKRQKSYGELGSIRVRDGDEARWVMPGTTRGVLVLLTSHGSAYTVRVNDLALTSGYGEPLAARFDFADGERVVGALTNHEQVTSRYASGDNGGVTVCALTESGLSVRFELDSFWETSTVRGRTYMRLADGDRVVNAEPSAGGELVALATKEGRGLTFSVDEIALYKGAAKGVKAVSLDEDDRVLDFTLTKSDYDGLEVETNRGARQVVRASLSKFAPTSRGNRGRWVIQRGYLIRSHRAPVEIAYIEPGEEE